MSCCCFDPAHVFYSPSIWFSLFSLMSLLPAASALVHLRGNAYSFTFADAPARFAVPVEGAGICGSLNLADPLDACSALKRGNSTGEVRFVLVVRGSCSFDTKVRNAQDAGFDAVIVYDDQDKGNLISMIGNPDDIWIHAIFVSKMVGETLRNFARGEEGECCISPSKEENAATVLVISLVSLVIVISVLATFFITRNCRGLHHVAQNHPQMMNREAVDILPCLTYKEANPSKCMSETCAICLEDYKDGETLRVLPCQHEFHSICIDSWLTKWGTFCPVCKQDVRSGK